MGVKKVKRGIELKRLTCERGTKAIVQIAPDAPTFFLTRADQPFPRLLKFCL
jgi:hypothetical protein